MDIGALKELVKSLSDINIRALITYEIISVFIMHLMFMIRLYVKELTYRKLGESYGRYGKDSGVVLTQDRKALAIKECIINSRMKMLKYEDKFFGLSVLSMIPGLNIITGVVQGAGIGVDIYKYNKNMKTVKEITCQE